MKNHNTVLQLKSYGRLHCKLKEQLDSRHLTRNYLAKAVNTRFEVIDKWYDDRVERIDADVAARICFVLDCKMEDLFVYVKESNEKER